jgi:spoIIIJ-associated protein
MLTLLGHDLHAELVAAGPDGVTIELDGADRRALLHRDGELLQSLQFLLGRMARRQWPDAGRVRVSCPGERRVRDEDVVDLAREVADEVARTGRPKRLRPMNAYERRLVHITIREYAGLDSRSEGDGSLKRVRIVKQGPGGPSFDRES